MCGTKREAECALNELRDGDGVITRAANQPDLEQLTSELGKTVVKHTRYIPVRTIIALTHHVTEEPVTE